MYCTIAHITKINESRLKVEIKAEESEKIQDFHLSWFINSGEILKDASVFEDEEAQLFDDPEAEILVSHITKCPSNFSLADGRCWNTSENQVMSVH